jgi:hypothetical protein
MNKIIAEPDEQSKILIRLASFVRSLEVPDVFLLRDRNASRTVRCQWCRSSRHPACEYVSCFLSRDDPDISIALSNRIDPVGQVSDSAFAQQLLQRVPSCFVGLNQGSVPFQIRRQIGGIESRTG